MRFDDRLKTVLKSEMPTGQAAVIQYRQLVDLLGRDSGADINPQSARSFATALTRIHALGRDISRSDQISVVQSIAGQLKSPVLTRYFLGCDPQIARAAIKSARLSDDDWTDIIPEMTVTNRGALRHRHDLGVKAKAMLAHYGISDQVLTDVIADERQKPVENVVEQHPAQSAERSGQSISDIVQRIETFRAQRSGGAARAETPRAKDNMAAKTIAFDHQDDAPHLPLAEFSHDSTPPSARHAVTINIDGAITRCSGLPVGALFGISMAQPAIPRSPGVDAAVASAFARRAPIVAGRLVLAGGEHVTGDWRIDAEPVFVSETGRFDGYRGVIRRPQMDEKAEHPVSEREVLGADNMRQLIHELRTPLGAIMGFSEIIEQQLFGPVTAEYRELAQQISRDAHYLLAGFDDLDTALKLDRGTLEDAQGTTTTGWLKSRLESRLAPLIHARHCSLDIALDFEGDALAVSHPSTDRIVLRLAAALVSLAKTDERLDLRSQMTGNGFATLWFSKPAQLADIANADLFDPESGSAAQLANAPLLGIGFGLRLVRNLVKAQGGQLEIKKRRIGLTLPLTRSESGVLAASDAGVN